MTNIKKYLFIINQFMLFFRTELPTIADIANETYDKIVV